MIHRSSLTPIITVFRPVGQQVLLRRHERPEKIGAIVLPSNARFVDLAKFSVIKCGPKCESVKAGDTAYAPAQLAFSKVTIGTEELEVAPENILSAYEG